MASENVSPTCGLKWDFLGHDAAAAEIPRGGLVSSAARPCRVQSAARSLKYHSPTGARGSELWCHQGGTYSAFWPTYSREPIVSSVCGVSDASMQAPREPLVKIV